MRLTSDFFVSALVRRCFSENAYASVVSKGALEAGAIYIVVDRRDGFFDLYGPAPQSAFQPGAPGGRLFEALLTSAPKEDLDRRLASERRMDPDVWIVEIEDRDGRVFWDVVES